jgi:hypothetical protein
VGEGFVESLVDAEREGYTAGCEDYGERGEDEDDRVAGNGFED